MCHPDGMGHIETEIVTCNYCDLVIMAPTMEQLGRRVADWRDSLLGKGLKVNAGKSKVMVGSSGGKMIVNSGK